MKKTLTTILFFIFYANQAGGAMIIHVAGGGAPPGGCATQSAATQNLETGNGHNVYAGEQSGQSFQVPSDNTEVYSIIISILADEMESPDSYTMTLRIDDDTDLRTVAEGAASEPLGSVDITYSWDDGLGEKEFVFDSESRPTLQSSTTYYWMVEMPAAAYADRLWIDGRESGDPDYTGGTVGDNSGGDWQWDGTVTGKYDEYFKVMECD